MPSAERAQQGQAGCPEHGRRENFSLGRRTVEYTYEGSCTRGNRTRQQRKAAKLTQLVEARVHRRDSTREQSAYCLMHASLKQLPRDASSGSPDHALHSLVYIDTCICLNREPILYFLKNFHPPSPGTDFYLGTGAKVPEP